MKTPSPRRARSLVLSVAVALVASACGGGGGDEGGGSGDPDAFRFIVSADNGLAAVTTFAIAANGDIPPTRSIGGSASNLYGWGAGVDNVAGEIYVSDFNDDQILVFDLTDDGNVAAKRAIVGPNTLLDGPSRYTFDHANGEFYVGQESGAGGGASTSIRSATSETSRR